MLHDQVVLHHGPTEASGMETQPHDLPRAACFARKRENGDPQDLRHLPNGAEHQVQPGGQNQSHRQLHFREGRDKLVSHLRSTPDLVNLRRLCAMGKHVSACGTKT